MFDRFTEKARRIIFFARYEASQYGSPSLDSEHILLGLLREDRALMSRFHLDLAPEIRDEIDKVVHRGTSVSTSTEMPLSTHAKNILVLAGEEAARLAHRHIGTEHILLGILRVPDSLAAKLLLAKGAKTAAIRVEIARGIPAAGTVTYHPATTSATSIHAPMDTSEALAALDQFLALLKRGASDELAGFFDQKGQFIDASGKCWSGRAEIEKGAETLLAPFAKRNADFRIEDTTVSPSHTFLASIIWQFATSSAGWGKSAQRMSVVMALVDQQWSITLVQITPIALS